MLRIERHVTAVLLVILCAVTAPAQQLVRVTPEAGEPGDVITITGTNLGGTTIVRFGADVGGFAGFWVVQVVPIQVTSVSVTAVVPVFGNFLPPGVFPPSNPFGTVDTGGPGFALSLGFFYMEQTQGQVSTPGLGTSQGGLAGRPVIGFTLVGGPPTTGNGAFTLTLENAVPNSVATLALGSPASPPLVPYLNGLVALDLLQPIVAFGSSFIVNSSGDVLFPIPIPPFPFGATLTIQWIVVDSVSSAIGISNGMSAQL
jgi:hypothetical protein